MCELLATVWSSTELLVDRISPFPVHSNTLRSVTVQGRAASSSLPVNRIRRPVLPSFSSSHAENWKRLYLPSSSVSISKCTRSPIDSSPNYLFMFAKAADGNPTAWRRIVSICRRPSARIPRNFYYRPDDIGRRTYIRDLRAFRFLTF